MAYQLKPDEAVAPGLKRIVRQELGSALEQLGKSKSTDDAIHEARKSLKKVRAVLQLVGHGGKVRRASKRLSSAGRLLAPVRDAEAVIVTADNLCRQDSDVPLAAMCSTLRGRLQREKAHTERVARREQVGVRSRKALKKVRRSVKRWRWNDIGLRELLTAIRKTYKRAQRGMRGAHNAQQSEAFHEWRKQVKALWYALRLIDGRVIGLDRQLAELGQLETWLGDDHNLWVLRARVGRGPMKRAVKAAAESTQRLLRQRALATGARFFSTSPKSFEGELRRHRQAAPRGTARCA